LSWSPLERRRASCLARRMNQLDAAQGAGTRVQPRMTATRALLRYTGIDNAPSAQIGPSVSRNRRNLGGQECTDMFFSLEPRRSLHAVGALTWAGAAAAQNVWREARGGPGDRLLRWIHQHDHARRYGTLGGATDCPRASEAMGSAPPSAGGASRHNHRVVPITSILKTSIANLLLTAGGTSISADSRWRRLRLRKASTRSPQASRACPSTERLSPVPNGRIPADRHSRRNDHRQRAEERILRNRRERPARHCRRQRGYRHRLCIAKAQ